MSISDHDYVNFSEEHELNYQLKKVEKRQTENNRNVLKLMGEELKRQENKSRLKHSEFHPYVKKEKQRLA